MNSNIFIGSKLLKLTVLEINCKKLDTPSEKSLLKIFVEMGIDFNDEKTDQGYEFVYNISIKCKEDDDEKLFSLNYTAKAIYDIKSDSDNISKKFEKVKDNFLRELYMMALDYLNNTLFRMKVRFQLPAYLPKDVKEKTKKLK